MKLCIGLKIIKDQNQSETFSRSCYNLNLDIYTESNFIYLVIWNCDLKSKHVLYEDRDQTFRSHFSRVELLLIGLEQIRSSGDLRESTLWRSFCHQSNKKKFVIANQFTTKKILAMTHWSEYLLNILFIEFYNIFMLFKVQSKQWMITAWVCNKKFLKPTLIISTILTYFRLWSKNCEMCTIHWWVRHMMVTYFAWAYF